MGSKLVSFESALTKWNGAQLQGVQWTGGEGPQSRLPFSILVVDERDVNRQWLAAILTNESRRAARYRVLEARSAEEALALMRHEPVDLVIVDQQVQGSRGVECWRAIRGERRTYVPALMLVADHGPE
ncbi:MAG: response regulator, partial [Bryobacteraceae bacterium]